MFKFKNQSNNNKSITKSYNESFDEVKRIGRGDIHEGNKYKLISEFIQHAQSSTCIESIQNQTKVVKEHHQQIKKVTMTKSIPTNEIFKDFSSIKNQKQSKQIYKMFQSDKMLNSRLKNSFYRNHLDTSTYETLMNQFMGGYLQEKFSTSSQTSNFKSINLPNENEIVNGYPKTSLNSFSPINQRSNSTVTFSGEKQMLAQSFVDDPHIKTESRIIQQEQYFLYDRLKNSKLQKMKASNRKHPEHYIEELYKLSSSPTVRKISPVSSPSIPRAPIIPSIQSIVRISKQPIKKFTIAKSNKTPKVEAPIIIDIELDEINFQQEEPLTSKSTFSKKTFSKKSSDKSKKAFDGIQLNSSSSSGLSSFSPVKISSKPSNQSKSSSILKSHTIAHNLSKISENTEEQQMEPNNKYIYTYSYDPKEQANDQIQEDHESLKKTFSQSQNFQNSRKFSQSRFNKAKKQMIGEIKRDVTLLINKITTSTNNSPFKSIDKKQLLKSKTKLQKRSQSRPKRDTRNRF